MSALFNVASEQARYLTAAQAKSLGYYCYQAQAHHVAGGN